MLIRRILPLLLVLCALVFGAFVPKAGAQSYQDGLEAFRSGQFPQAFNLWKPLAEAGNPQAQFGLAVIYEKGGQAVGQNLDEAARWYELAAVQGHTAAQNNLGHMYSQGLGVQRDKARAVELWKEAAKGGHETAYYNLGLAYYRGEGTPKNETEAAKWFGRAADAGLQEGQFAIGEMYRLGIGTERNESRALAWYDLAAAQGHRDGQRLSQSLRQKGVRPANIAPRQNTADSGNGAGGDNLAALVPETPPAEASPEPGEAAPEPESQAAPTVVPERKPSGQRAPAEAVAAAPAAQEAGDDVASPTETQTAKAAVSASDGDAAPVAARASAQTAALPPAGGSLRGVHIWLASMESVDDAQSHWLQVEDQHEGLFDDLPHLFTKVNLGELGTFYRVLVGPIDSRDDAQSICQQMRSSDPAAFCKVLVR